MSDLTHMTLEQLRLEKQANERYLARLYAKLNGAALRMKNIDTQIAIREGEFEDESQDQT